MNAVGYTFLILVTAMVMISISDKRGQRENNGLEIDPAMFRVSNSFAFGSAIVLCIIAALYALFW
jgi:SSS family solute:Na+ symporter